MNEENIQPKSEQTPKNRGVKIVVWIVTIIYSIALVLSWILAIIASAQAPLHDPYLQVKLITWFLLPVTFGISIIGSQIALMRGISGSRLWFFMLLPLVYIILGILILRVL